MVILQPPSTCQVRQTWEGTSEYEEESIVKEISVDLIIRCTTTIQRLLTVCVNVTKKYVAPQNILQRTHYPR